MWRGILFAIATLLLLAACGGGRRTTTMQQAKVSEGLIDHGHPVGGALDAHVRKGERHELRIFVRGAGGRGGIVVLRGYGIEARVKRQPPASGFWARLRFRATRVGRFAVVMKRPHVRVGYVIVSSD